MILHESTVGDFVVMSAGIREIRRIYPTVYITLVVEKKAKSLAECCPYIDELIVEDFTIDGRLIMNISYFEHLMELYMFNLNIAAKVLHHRYDIAFISNNGSFSTAPLLGYMCGARELISHSTTSSGIEQFLTVDVPQRDYGIHAADKFLSYIEYLIRLPIANRSLEAWVDETDIETAQKLLPKSEKLCAIGLGGRRKRKHYPPEFYAEFINMLFRAEPEMHFVIAGGEAEIEEAKIIMSNVTENRIIDLTGKTTFRETTAVLSFCSLYIGNDSCAMHLAAATETPVLSPSCYPLDVQSPHVVFERWYPYGVPSVIVCPSHALPECRGSVSFWGCIVEEPHCIKQITPNAMFEAYNLLLERIAQGNTEPMIVGAK